LDPNKAYSVHGKLEMISFQYHCCCNTYSWTLLLILKSDHFSIYSTAPSSMQKLKNANLFLHIADY